MHIQALLEVRVSVVHRVLASEVAVARIVGNRRLQRSPTSRFSVLCASNEHYIVYDRTLAGARRISAMAGCV